MNTSGQVGGILCPIIVTWLKQAVGWNAALWLIGGLFLIGAVCWCLIDPHRRIFAEDT
jgi:dipeptide/tripeptide permease